MAERPRVHDLLRQKGSRKWPRLRVANGEDAAAAVEAGIAILSCEADGTLGAVRAAVPSAFVPTGTAHGSVASPDEALRAWAQDADSGAYPRPRRQVDMTAGAFERVLDLTQEL